MAEQVAVTASDEQLVQGARSGSQRAFAELWRRHYKAGVRVARQFSTLDADDVVSEAFARIFKSVSAGGGPTGAFRPYLYTCIRNVASTWGAASRDIAVDDLSQFEDPTSHADPAADALDRTLTARAFRSLPERWQTVLWYTEVEGMDPHEVAPVLGMSANGVAALSYRAREGLRKAWLQAHITDAAASGECRWTLSKLADHARQSLGVRDSRRVIEHLGSCAKCAIISAEVDEVGSRLASVLMPILLGGAAGGTFLASLHAPSAAVAVEVPPLPDLSGTDLAAGAAGVVGAAGLASVLSTPAVVAGSIAVAFAVAGATAIVAVPQFTPTFSASPTDGGATDAAPPESSADGAPPADAPHNIPALDDPRADAGSDSNPGTEGSGAPGDAPTPGGGTGAPGGGGLGGIIGGITDEVDDLTDSIVDTITGDQPPPGHTAPGGVVGIDVSLAGTGTPGAHLSLQAAGQVYATTTVRPDGSFTISATAIPGGLSSLQLVQHVDRSYLATLLPGGGILEKLLGTLDSLVNALIKPLNLTVGSSQINVVLLS